MEHILDFSAAHFIEIVRYQELTGKEIESIDLFADWSIQSYDLDHGFTSLGDDEGFPFYCLIDQARQLGFGFMDVNRVHKHHLVD
jgi:hypothetical protein